MLMTAEYSHSTWLLDPIRMFYAAEHTSISARPTINAFC